MVANSCLWEDYFKMEPGLRVEEEPGPEWGVSDLAQWKDGGGRLFSSMRLRSWFWWSAYLTGWRLWGYLLPLEP